MYLIIIFIISGIIALLYILYSQLKSLIEVTNELSIENSGISAKAIDMQRIINYVKLHQGSSRKELIDKLEISSSDFKILIDQCLSNKFLFKTDNKFYFKKK